MYLTAFLSFENRSKGSPPKNVTSTSADLELRATSSELLNVAQLILRSFLAV
jgi:hypothetical protein